MECVEKQKPKQKKKRARESVKDPDKSNPKDKYAEPIPGSSKPIDLSEEINVTYDEIVTAVDSEQGKQNDCKELEKVPADTENLKEISKNLSKPESIPIETIQVNVVTKKLDLLLKEQFKPEAPKPAQDTFEKLLQTNKEIVNTLIQEQTMENLAKPNTLTKKERQILKPPNQWKPKEISSDQPCVRAYTESQLSALYANHELDALEQFILDFIEAESKGIAVKRHPLFDLLEAYLQVRSKITGNILELEQLRKEYNEAQGQAWSLENAVIHGRAECQDGSIVTASHSYTRALFHRTVFQTIGRILNSVRVVVTENHTLYSYSAELLRLQIEIYLQTLIANCISASQLPRSAPICLSTQTPPPHLIMILCELRLCVSVIFIFQRRLIRDVQFVKETRDWLSRLISVLLRLANWQDHLFLLNHILRCPPGVGTWAAPFVQAPLPERLMESPFASYHINHIVSVLAVLLMPIQKREEFLEQFSLVQEAPVDALWVMVDSDGEEDDETLGTALKENDVVQLLNQLPLDDLFRATMLVQRKNNEDHYDGQQITEHHIMRFLAFSTILLKILRRGLRTYDHPRYNQFLKRLCRFIRHVVQYATDQWEHFRTCQKLDDMAMLQRLQVEYDAFFLRATHYLYSSQRMEAWQFLAVVPYNMVSLRTLWRIFYLLHDDEHSAELILEPTDVTDYREKLWEDSLRSQFEEKLGTMADAESYYLLNTFANMVLARGDEDMEFIQTATLDLLQVGFISEATQENCSKNARILLAHITSKYPHLLSDILKSVKKHMTQIRSLCLYLYSDLPLLIWKPSESDMEIIGNWLTQSNIAEDESRLARMILSRLNWDTVPDGVLFLPYSFHCRVALLLAQVVQQEPGYLQWAWQTAFRLRLHFSDKGIGDLGWIPDIERFDVINRGTREQQPFPCFLAILMTSWGHLIPLVCTKGLAQLQVLLQHQKYDAIIFALNLIVPLFLDCQESLINCEKFQTILMGVLSADRGYVNVAKSLVSTQNVILERFGCMVQSQIVNFGLYNLESPRCLVRLWINSLVSIPNWNKDYGALYLIDVIIQAAFFHTDALEVVTGVLQDLLQCATPQEQTSSISSLFKWASQSTSPQGSLLATSSLPSCIWLAYILIDLEYEEREKQTGLWKEVLTQLKNQKGKVNVDACIKKAASIVKVPSFTSSSLCIYRWAQQALDTPIEHPLLPLLWQKFFILYLVRVPVSGVVDRGCVGEKFFEGIINLSFLKRLKKRLQETQEFYKKKTENCDNDSEAIKLLYQQCFRVFRAYSLWLEEPHIQEASLHLPSLPAQYEPRLLALIIQGNTTPWLEYIDYDSIKAEQQNSLKTWRVSIYREKSNVNLPLPNAGSGIESSDPVERILRRLNSYDVVKAAPPLSNAAPVIPTLTLTDKTAMFKTLTPHFQTLHQFARNHNLRISEHTALDSTYKDLLPQLYRSVLIKIKKQVSCKGTSQSACTGAAVITLEMQEARINDRIDHQIQSNRSDYESMLSKSMQAPAQTLCLSSVVIQKTIDILEIQIKTNKEAGELGVELFYHILSLISEENNLYPATKQFFATCLRKLGQVHICGIEFETPRLLNKILETPNMITLLAPHFSPINAGTVNFLHMYTTISNTTSQRFDVIHALLSQFDIEKWLVGKQPKLIQRTQFIEMVVKALTTLGYEPPMEAMELHEVYRRHLLCIFEYQFPEHYGDVLTTMLTASNGTSDTGSISVTVWMDILNSLSKPIKLKLGVLLRDLLRQYAQQQRVLHYQELLETCNLLARHFSSERLQYGLYGLYPKYRNYVEVLVLLLGTSGHALIIGALNTHQGALADKLGETIWPQLRDMFAPWVLPYWLQNMKENMAAWMQQLTDDRAVLLPWIPGDGPFAQKAVHMFFECVMFVIHTLPACNKILSFVWHWYVTNFAHPSIKDHILNTIHASFLALPWHNFWPTFGDLELMWKVVEQYLPECHVFLGHIFMEVPWAKWLSHLCQTSPPQVITRVHQCLLHLLVKLANEPNVRTNHTERVKTLLLQAEAFNWNMLEPSMFQHVMDWYVMSCDPLVLFSTDPMSLDFRVLHLLKVVAYYDQPLEETHQKLLQKRHIFVRSYVKLASVLMSKHKTLVPTKEKELNIVITVQLNHMETVVRNDEELCIILSELLGILNIIGLSSVLVKAFEQWIANKPSHSVILQTVFKCAGTAVGDLPALAVLYETALCSYFTNSVSEGAAISWKGVASLLKPFTAKQTELESVLLEQEKLLTLHALIIQRGANTTDKLALLNTVLQWLSRMKASTKIEDKLPLIWSQVLLLSLQLCELDEASAGAVLYKFSQLLLPMASEKSISGWGKGFLGAIGIGKPEATSLKFRFLCRALSGYVLAQLPETKGQPQTVRRSSNARATVGQPGGNTECVKVLLGLDFGQSQGEIKTCAEIALKQIQDPSNSLHNARKFLALLVTQLYIKPYLKDLDA